MTNDEIMEVVSTYKELLAHSGFAKKSFPHDQYLSNFDDVLKHILYMLDEIEIMLKNGQHDKALRWLGFIQGCLWAKSFFTLDMLKEHNRP